MDELNRTMAKITVSISSLVVLVDGNKEVLIDVRKANSHTLHLVGEYTFSKQTPNKSRLLTAEELLKSLNDLMLSISKSQRFSFAIHTHNLYVKCKYFRIQFNCM